MRTIDWDTYEKYEDPSKSINNVNVLRPMRTDAKKESIEERSNRVNKENTDNHDKDIFYTPQMMLEEIPLVVKKVTDDLFNSKKSIPEIFHRDTYRPLGLFFIILATSVLILLLLDRA